MRHVSTLLSISLVTAALAAAGCDQPAGPDYEGEVLASLRGTVVDDRSTDTSAAKVVLVWGVDEAPIDRHVATEVPVAGAFPAEFRLDVFEPPPDDALMTPEGVDEPRIGVAYVLVVPEDAETADEAALLGGAEDHVLVYVDRDVVAGTFAADLLHGTPTQGYHLMDVVREPGAVFDLLYEADQGLATWIEARLVDDPAQFAFPNWM